MNKQPLVDSSNQPDDSRKQLKLMMNKISTLKKEKDILSNSNTSLLNEIANLQIQMRTMVSGFNNTSNDFPLTNEISNFFTDFYKAEAFDLFFDVLSTELNLKGVLFFYSHSYKTITQKINDYFQACFTKIMETGLLPSIEGPIKNTLLKSFQPQMSKIKEKCISQQELNEISTFLITKLELPVEQRQVIVKYMEQLYSALLMSFLSDPQLQIKSEHIGEKVNFSSVEHEAIDGFLKSREECRILVPSVCKNNEILVKCLVIKPDYFDNL